MYAGIMKMGNAATLIKMQIMAPIKAKLIITYKIGHSNKRKQHDKSLNEKKLKHLSTNLL
jgi:hypothetical protein